VVAVAGHGFRVTHSSALPNWRTEDRLYEALDEEFGFRWDAAATAGNAKVGRFYHEGFGAPYFGPDRSVEEYRDALAIPDWRKAALERTFFCNPPSSRETGDNIGRWFAKFEEQALHFGAIVVAVVPHRPSERYWKHTRSAVEIRQIPHRVRYWIPAEELAAVNEARRLLAEERGRAYAPITSGNTAGFPTAVVIWRPQPGIIQPSTPRVVTWTYRAPK
jgi:hypothetical protein